ncbi:MAG: pyridoxal-phosphate dependent enzyme [Chitinophagaceae bacterium]|nr:pyridoxal-phosphate dependent enzyme [Chitinophagaceae bacterium]
MIQPSDLPDIQKACVQTLNDGLFEQNKIRVQVLRLDKIHSIISGNKWFKLKYYLTDATRLGKKGIISFGGAFSNHLLSTAYSCRQAGLSSIGIVRGEKPSIYSPTLLDLQSYGMELHFYSRPAYNDKQLSKALQQSYPDFLLVEEGGRGQAGIKGAEDILRVQPSHLYTHIVCAVGTGTMMTGILNTALADQKIIGLPVLKIETNNRNDIFDYISNNSHSSNFRLQYDFHFGGYAKKNEALIEFMNRLYQQHQVPTDFVYTGKLFYGVFKMIENGFFEPGSSILLIHSGGLQGNRSLPVHMLDFSY